MIPHEDMTLGQRFLLTLVIALVILFAFAVAGWMTDGWEAPAAPIAASPFDQRLAELDEGALDVAYENRVTHLFEVWMRDATDQPRRFLVGVNQARAAYTQAMIEVQKRKKQ